MWTQLVGEEVPVEEVEVEQVSRMPGHEGYFDATE